MEASANYTWVEELGPNLTEEQANSIFEQGREAVIFALLTMSKRLAEQSRLDSDSTPSTPSGMIPVYKKPRVRRSNGKTGRSKGHEGVRRQPPKKIDDYQEHRLERCPNCNNPVEKECDLRKRVIEDIPKDIQPEVTEHTIYRYYCKDCKQVVEPVVTDALPGATIGNHLLALTAWLHYGLGNTLSQIVSVLNFHLHFSITDGGLIQMWQRLSEILYGWYEKIGQEAKGSALLHGDETGWRVGGVTHWLWCFTNKILTYYLIAKSRGSPALKRFFTEAFEGVLITDFWGAYNKIVSAARQVCLSHLLRDLSFTDETNRSDEWVAFRKRLKRILRDSIRLSLREDYPERHLESRRSSLHARLDGLLEESWTDPDAKRLVKRLRRHREHLFTFLDQSGIPFDNNHAEREIRPAVIIRKNCLCNRTDRGANTQAVLMSVYRTLKLRGHDPIKTIAMAVAEYLRTGHLPPLPPPLTSVG